MKQNVGSVDQNVRIAVGAVAGTASLAILLGAISLPAVLSPLLGLIAVMMLATAATGNCPLYSLLGVTSCPRDSGPSGS
ncbi:YgaP family membrane protein [Halalkalirubrum salinum]|uniref:YgaP family membrane protein n=1 Tax=Halalkalirubrum salinum TaxID=2563889 RepID=UPI0010FAF85A|nr:DUF2892 domain-containing protein [Halalkalirubrum salinum]